MRTFVVALSFTALALAHPNRWRSTAHLSEEDLERLTSHFTVVGAQPHPGPATDTSARLVNDKAHPWEPLRPGDHRGPCPAMNTLASHGYLARNGIVTPAEVVTAVQDGFNMNNDLALFVTYMAHLVDGNLLTNLMSLGEATWQTGPPPPSPAIAGGLDTHFVFEGDASVSRGDIYWGDNHSFNETLFQKMIAAANEHGNGLLTHNASSELRYQIVQEGIATNPAFTLVNPRSFTAYVESAFPQNFFVDGRVSNVSDPGMKMDDGRGFFQDSRMPTDFYRRAGAFGFAELVPKVGSIFFAHPVLPGRNNGAGNYTIDMTSASLAMDGNPVCNMYTAVASETIPSLYPNPKGALLAAIKGNMQNWFDGVVNLGCTQVFPYGE